MVWTKIHAFSLPVSDVARVERVIFHHCVLIRIFALQLNIDIVERLDVKDLLSSWMLKCLEESQQKEWIICRIIPRKIYIDND